jgi:hypothetical protein
MESIERNCVHGSGFLDGCEPMRDRMRDMARASSRSGITEDSQSFLFALCCLLLLSRALVI